MKFVAKKIFLMGVVSSFIGCGGGSGNNSGVTGSNAVCNAFRIFNGAECDADNTPVVQLIIDGQATCTGTVISNDDVLTAAHCVQFIQRGVVATHDHGSQSAVAGVANPLSSVSGNFDVGLLKFPGIATNFNIVPAHFLVSTVLKSGDKIKVIGYGFDGTAALMNGNPRGVELRVNSIDENGIITFFDENNAGTCFGDSGGAATLNGKIVGTVESGSANCAQGNYNLFSNMQIKGNVDFIQEYVGGAVFE